MGLTCSLTMTASAYYGLGRVGSGYEAIIQLCLYRPGVFHVSGGRVLMYMMNRGLLSDRASLRR